MLDFAMCGLTGAEALDLIGQMFDLTDTFKTEPFATLDEILLDEGDPHLAKILEGKLSKQREAAKGSWQKAYAQACQLRAKLGNRSSLQKVSWYAGLDCLAFGIEKRLPSKANQKGQL